MKRHQTITISLWLNPKFCIQTISKTPRKFETWCIARICLVLPKTFSMTYLYFSKLFLCLFTKALSKYAIMCSIKNVMTISYNHHVAIHLGSLSLSFLRFQVCVDEMFSPLDISATLRLCMVEGGPFKGLGVKSWMMCKIICFKGLGQIDYLMVVY